tara:strand:+ start:222 stop:440 length:219 start_codon:yes stop_codon:yes gene_type:complete
MTASREWSDINGLVFIVIGILWLLWNGIQNLENRLSRISNNQVRSILSNIFPEYLPDLSSNEIFYLKVKVEV